MRNFYAVVAFGNDDKHVVQYPKSAAQSALQDIKRLTHPEESRVAGHNSEMLKGTSISMASRKLPPPTCTSGSLQPHEPAGQCGGRMPRANRRPAGPQATGTQVGCNTAPLPGPDGRAACPRFTEWGRKKYKAKGDKLGLARAVEQRTLPARRGGSSWASGLKRQKRFLRAVANALCVTVPKFAL